MKKAYKNRYGIGDEPFIASVINKIPPPIRSPFAKINTIEPVVIYPELPDSLEFAGDELMAAEMDIPDSTAFEEDSVEVSKNWHFNIEQENYFNYILKRLEIPIEPVENEEGEEGEDMLEEGMEGEALESDSTSQDGKKRGGLKGLFKRNKKKDSEETDEESTDTDPDKNQDTEEKQNN